MIPYTINIFKVAAREEKFAVSRVVEALNKRDNRGFATTWMSNKSNNLVFLHINRDTFDYFHICLGRVGKLHIIEFDVHFTSFFTIYNIVNVRFSNAISLHKVWSDDKHSNLVTGAKNFCNSLDIVRYGASVVHQGAYVEHDCGNISECQIKSLISSCYNVDNCKITYVGHKLVSNEVDGPEVSLWAPIFKHGLVLGLEFQDRQLFISKSFHCANIGDWFFANMAHLSLTLLINGVETHEVDGAPASDQYLRHNCDNYYQSQPAIIGGNNDDASDYNTNRFDEHGDIGCKSTLYDLSVWAQSWKHITCTEVIIEVDVLFYQWRKESQSHTSTNLLASNPKDSFSNGCAHTAENRHTNPLDNDLRDGIEVFFAKLINYAADVVWRQEIDGTSKEHEWGTDGKPAPLLLDKLP